MKKLFILFITFYSLVIPSLAQNHSTEKKQTIAIKYFNDDDFENAIVAYKSLILIDSIQSDYYYQLGVCYIKIGKQIESLPFFEKAEKLNHPNIKIYYYLGTTNHLKHNFDIAIHYFELLIQKFKEQDVADKLILEEVNNLIAQCNVGKVISKKPLNVIIENLGNNINSEYPEYIPLITADEQTLIFTTRRPKNEASKKDLVDNHYFEDVYISKKENGIWQMATPIKGFINTVHHDACVSLNYDGNKLYLYKEQSGDIYYSNFKNNAIGWTLPEPLNENINTKYWEPSAYESSEDCTMYFSSNKPGGYGGLDLYKSKMINGDWGPAENLGPKINTEEDEDAPFVHKKNNSLYFSSKSHNNMGGYDIFISKFDIKTKDWSTPQNIGYPLNSAGDDIFFSWNENLSTVYFSSIRADSYGEKDIYRATNIDKEQPIKVYNEQHSLTINNQKITGKILEEKLSNFNKTYVYLTHPNNGLLKENIDTINKFKYESLPFSSNKIIFESPILKTKEHTDALPESIISNKKPSSVKFVYLINAKNEIVKHTRSDSNGNFTFNDLPPFEEFKLVFSSIENKNKFKNSNVNTINYSNKNNSIIYGKILTGTNRKVTLLSKDSTKSTLTNKEGNFAFIQLTNDEYSVTIQDNDGKKIVVPSIKIPADSCLFVSKETIAKFKYNKLPLNTNIVNLNIEIYGKINPKIGVEPVGDIRLLLIDEKGNTVGITKTTLEGYFKFSKLKHENYYVLFENYNPNLKAELLDYADSTYFNTKQKNALKSKLGSVETPLDSTVSDIGHLFIQVHQDSLQKLKNEKTNNQLGEFVFGTTFYKNSNLPASDIQTHLLNQNNDLIFQTTTNKNGHFAFKDLPLANYKIDFSVKTPRVKSDINYITSDFEIKIPSELSSNGKNLIVYGKLNGTSLKENLQHSVFLINDNGKVINTLADKNGYFAFIKLDNSNYSLIIKPNTIPKLKIQPMLDLTDRCLFIPQSTVQKFKYHKIEKSTSDKIIHFILQGKIKANIPSQSINDISMLLIDNDGNIVDKTNTNGTGHFTFHKLQLGNYYVVFETQNSNLKAEIVYAEDNSTLVNNAPKKHFLNEKVYFDYKSISLDDSSKITLTDIIKLLKQNPLNKINIYTYADPFGSNQYNLKLTAQRAQTIKNYFILHGIPKNSIEIIPRGEFKPLIISEDKSTNRLNRRAEFEIINH